MLKKSMEKALNRQLNREFESSYLYLSMSAWLESKSLVGMAAWMRIQTLEEMDHVMRFYNHIHQRGGSVKFEAVPAPQATWKSPLAVFEGALEHERKISRSIHQLVDLGVKDGDHPTQSFLQWFVAEQVEEEATADEIVSQLKLVGNSGSGLLLLDQTLGARKVEPEGE